MGITIDEIVKELEYIKDSGIFPFTDRGKLIDDSYMKQAIDTIHKYQKIVNIVSLNDKEFKQCGLQELKEILEVIADGNVD